MRPIVFATLFYFQRFPISIAGNFVVQQNTLIKPQLNFLIGECAQIDLDIFPFALVGFFHRAFDDFLKHPFVPRVNFKVPGASRVHSSLKSERRLRT